jgi:hypothetical protein
MFGIAVLIVVLVLLLRDSALGRALASRIERRSIDAGGEVVADRVAYLEGEIERLNAEVRRLDEEGQFLHRLLLEKPEERGALPARDRAD